MGRLHLTDPNRTDYLNQANEAAFDVKQAEAKLTKANETMTEAKTELLEWDNQEPSISLDDAAELQYDRHFSKSQDVSADLDDEQYQLAEANLERMSELDDAKSVVQGQVQIIEEV